MKPVLIDDHATKADALLAKIKTHYLSKVHLLIYRIQSLGITGINKEMLIEAIDRNLQPLREKYREIYEKDVEVFATPEMRDQVENGFVLKFKGIEAAIEDFHTTEISNRLPLSLEGLSGLFELDENLKPFIPELKAAVIREGFKEFIEQPDLLRIYNLHNDVAQKLQELVNLIRSSGMASKNALFQSGLLAIQGLFLLEDNQEPWLISVKPRPLDYKGAGKALLDEINEAQRTLEGVEAFSRSKEVPQYGSSVL